MMMSIYERTKEIGVIKVLGCSLKNIKQMFLLEAAFVGFGGGVIGNIVSFLLSAIINFLTQGSGSMGLDGNISYIPDLAVPAVDSVRNDGRNGGRILPGSEGNEIKSVGGNPK